jgi:aspartate/methionine/tyrosine aminotransferase
VRPPSAELIVPTRGGALRATQTAVEDEANYWLPFTGKIELKSAVAEQLAERSGIHYDPETQVVITCGEGDAIVDAPFSWRPTPVPR